MKKSRVINVKKIIIEGLVFAQLIALSGCGKTVDCNIDIDHAHKYTSEEGLDKYLVSEKEKSGDFNRTDEYITTDKAIEKLIKFENSHDLFRISENKDYINEIAASKSDYMEYRYSYIYLMPIVHTRTNGKTVSTYTTYVPMTGYSWTDNSKHGGLTGHTRVVHHVYYGYKIVENENGKLSIIKSEPVDDPNLIPVGYNYVDEDIFKKVYASDKSKEVDYEDGPEEEHKLDEKTSDDEQKLSLN